MATLCLSVALQRVAPMPFYILDEVDSALDSDNVSNVANLFASEAKKGPQYILVTHRPEMIERCDAMVGIYSLQGSSTSISLELKPCSS